MVTSHGCECEDHLRAVSKGMSDAAAKLRVHVAPVRDVAGSPAKLEKIKLGKVTHLFWVYGGASTPDQLLDLSQETSIPAALVVKGRYLRTVAEWQWRALLVHAGVDRWHIEPEKIFHPDLFTTEETQGE